MKEEDKSTSKGPLGNYVDKLKKEEYNQAIEDVIEKVNLLKTMDIIFDTSVINEIQKLKKP